MADRLTVPDKLLVAALKLREQAKTFSAEDLVVKAWELFPDTFGLAGYGDRFPDSNRVLTKIMGTQGMRGKGWLRKIGEKQYRLTTKALNDGEQILELSGRQTEQAQPYLRAQIERATTMALDRLVSTRAVQKAFGEVEGEVSFTDACGFWDISARSNANTVQTRLKEIDDVLSRAASTMADSSHTSLGLKLTNRELSRQQIAALDTLHKSLQERFSSEISVLLRRTDERSARNRPSL